MELWVRSQDKTSLYNVNELHIGDSFAIYSRYDENDKWAVLGIYDSKDRCLEILDEIQSLMFTPTQIVFNKCNVDKNEYNTLCEQLKTNGISIVPSDSKVEYLDKDWVLYEMPEK